MLRSSMVVGFFSLLGGLSGILVETSIAAKLGLSRSSDTFYVAFTLPYIIITLISATGQFSLVPFFAALENQSAEEEQWRGFSYAVNMVFLGLGVLGALGAALSPWLVRAIAPGLTRPQIELAAQLCQWLFLIPIPAGVAEAFRSFLLSRHSFALASGINFIRNLTVITITLAGFRRYGPYSIVLGYLAGYVLAVVVLGVQILLSYPVRYSLTLAASGEAFRNLRGSGTVQLGNALGWQGVVVVERIIASFLPPGTLTALNYGFKIVSTLSELLTGSVGTAALPALSSAVARQAEAEQRKTWQDTLEISLVLAMPFMLFCLLLPDHIIRLVFQRGNFTPAATALMATVFFYYSLSLLSVSFVRLLTFYLFARQEAGLFFRLTVLYYGLTAAFDLFYVGVLRLGARGIPLALLSSTVITCALALRRDLGGVRRFLDRRFASFSLKNGVAGLLVVAAMLGLERWLSAPDTGLRNFLYLSELCGAGCVVYVAALAVLKAFPLTQVAEIWPRDERS